MTSESIYPPEDTPGQNPHVRFEFLHESRVGSVDQLADIHPVVTRDVEAE